MSSRCAASWKLLLPLLAAALFAGATAAPAPAQEPAPPPRTVTDVLAGLDTAATRNLEELATLTARADAAPPATEEAGVLLRFHLDRARAAGALGSGQELADLRLAAEYARDSALVSRTRLLLDLGWAELRGGRFTRGLALVRDGIRDTRRLARKAAQLAHLGGVLARSGDLAAAEQALDDAAGYYHGARRKLGEMGRAEIGAHIDAGRARVLDAAGRFREAETYHRRAVAALDAIAEVPVTGQRDPRARRRLQNVLTARLSSNLRRQGRLVEAELEARRALRRALALDGRHGSRAALMLGQLTRVVFAQGRYAEAEMLARTGVEILEQGGAASESLSLGAARRRVADALVAQGRWEDGIAVYERMRAEMAGDADAYRQFLDGNVDWALALIRTGRPGLAIPLLSPAVQRLSATLGDKHAKTALRRGFLAMALAATGAREAALAAFVQAVPVLMSRSRRAEGEGGASPARDQRLQQILGAYVGLLFDIRGTPLEDEAGIDAVAVAFRVAGAARGRTVQAALAAASARAAARDPALAALSRREQDALHQIAALYDRLAEHVGLPADAQDEAVANALRTGIDGLRDNRARLAEEIEARFPEYADLVNPKPATIAEARATLGAREALVATFVTDDHVYVWAVPKVGPVAVTRAPFGADQLAFHVAILRSALDSGARTVAQVPAFDLGLAHELYAALLAPTARLAGRGPAPGGRPRPARLSAALAAADETGRAGRRCGVAVCGLRDGALARAQPRGDDGAVGRRAREPAGAAAGRSGTTGLPRLRRPAVQRRGSRARHGRA